MLLIWSLWMTFHSMGQVIFLNSIRLLTAFVAFLSHIIYCTFTAEYLRKKGYFVISKEKPMGLTDSWNKGYEFAVSMVRLTIHRFTFFMNRRVNCHPFSYFKYRVMVTSFLPTMMSLSLMVRLNQLEMIFKMKFLLFP